MPRMSDNDVEHRRATAVVVYFLSSFTHTFGGALSLLNANTIHVPAAQQNVKKIM